METNYGYSGNNTASMQPPRTTTEADNIVSRLNERVDGVRNIAKRLDDLSNRLAGPRPRELSKQGIDGPNAAVPPFAHRVNNLDAQMSALIAECNSALNALESFV